MASINITGKVIDNIKNDDLAAFLNSMIDDELSKDVDKIDTDFVDECVCALLEIEKEQDDFSVLVPLIRSDKFLRRITGDNRNSFKKLNVFAKTAMVAAVIAGCTVSANAMIYSFTGVDVFQTIADKIESSIYKNVREEDDDIYQNTEEPVEKSDTSSTEDGSPAENSVSSAEAYTDPAGRQSVTAESSATADNSPSVSDDQGQAVTEKISAESEKSTKIALSVLKEETTESGGSNKTTEPSEEETTASVNQNKGEEANNGTAAEETTASAESYIPQKDAKRQLENISADLSEFKRDYIYGEEFSYDGLKLYANYNNGDREAISLDDCYYTKIYTTDKTADYTLTVIYNTCKLEIKITVRPDEYTRGSEICANSDYEYLLTDKGAYVTAYKGRDTVLEMQFIGDHKIIAVGADVFKGSAVTSVRADYAEKICSNAFKDCVSLEKCSFPNAVYIGESAFDGCTSLKELEYASDVSYLGSRAFRKTALTSAKIPDVITAIPEGLFEECTSLKHVALTEHVTEIGKNAFSECASLELVTGCENIETVGDYAFYGNEIMDFDVFPQNMKAVGDSAFYLCMKLEIGALPNSITQLGRSAFAYCAGITQITVSDKITVIPYEAFRGSGAKSVVIPEGVEIIESYAFRAVKCTEIVLPDTLKRIETQGVYSPLLRKIYLGNNLEDIADDAFYPSRSVTFYVWENSKGMEYAAGNALHYEIISKEEE